MIISYYTPNTVFLEYAAEDLIGFRVSGKQRSRATNVVLAGASIKKAAALALPGRKQPIRRLNMQGPSFPPVTTLPAGIDHDLFFDERVLAQGARQDTFELIFERGNVELHGRSQRLGDLQREGELLELPGR